MDTPMVLMYNLNNDKGSRLRLVCLKLHIRVRSVRAEEYAQPVGALAGLCLPVSGAPEAPGFEDEMLVLVNFDGALLNRFLGQIRASRTPGVALKAVLTPTNMLWSSAQLHHEIRREHEAMRYGASAHPSADEPSKS